MSKDRLERRTYRKSPGRQYEYDYDPLRNRSGRSLHSQNLSNSKPGDFRPSQGEMPSRPGMMLAQRPDPRRTRQLVRQNIIANKTRVLNEEEDQEYVDTLEDERRLIAREEQERYKTPYRQRSGPLSSRPYPPTTRQMMPEVGPNDDTWISDRVTADPHEEDFLEGRVRPASSDRLRVSSAVQPPSLPPVRPRSGFLARMPEQEGRGELSGPGSSPRSQRTTDIPDEELYEEDEGDYEEYEEVEVRPVRRHSKKRKISRRGLLIGLGTAAVGGGAIAAYVLAPKVPEALGEIGSNVEKQVEEAFKKGLEQGAEAARKEFLIALENLEGFTLEGAINAARLTRIAYDVFVSPVVQFGATITGDFLNGMLRALISGRDWLARIGQDNATLAAIQKVMESWVEQTVKMPKQLDAITQADLDGAQAYLRALQRKVDEEKAQLSGKATPTPTQQKTPQPTPTPTKKP